MSLLQRINEDRKEARRDGMNDLAQVLTTLFGEASMPGFNDGKRDSTDEEVVKVVTKFRNAAAENAALVGLTDDKREEFKVEEFIYNQYLPKQLTEVEMRDIITELITAQFIITTDKALKGKVMGYFKTNYAGQYDGKVLATLVDKFIETAK